MAVAVEAALRLVAGHAGLATRLASASDPTAPAPAAPTLASKLLGGSRVMVFAGGPITAGPGVHPQDKHARDIHPHDAARHK